MSFLIALLFTALAVEKVPPPFQYDPRAELPQIRGLRYVPDELEYHRPTKAEKLPVKTEEELPSAPEAAEPVKNCEEANNNTP